MRAAPLAACVLLLAPTIAVAQPNPGQIDTFEDGTFNNWSQGNGSTGLSLATGGPGGATDHFLKITGDGSGAAGRIVAFNEMQWTGNYTSPGVGTITMDLFAPTTNTQSLTVRVTLGRIDRTGYSSTTQFTLPADGAWHHASFTLSAATMTAVGNPTEPFDTYITNITEVRILNAAAPSFTGDPIVGVLGVDNVAAVAPVPEPAGGLAVGAAAGAAWVLVRRRRLPGPQPAG
jgi:hypothetical protein